MMMSVVLMGCVSMFLLSVPLTALVVMGINRKKKHIDLLMEDSHIIIVIGIMIVITCLLVCIFIPIGNIHRTSETHKIIAINTIDDSGDFLITYDVDGVAITQEFTDVAFGVTNGSAPATISIVSEWGTSGIGVTWCEKQAAVNLPVA